MSNSQISTDIIELVKPAAKDQIRARIDDAFKLGVFLKDLSVVDAIYEEMKHTYSPFQNGESDTEQGSENKDLGVNLITQKRLPPVKKRTKKTYHTGSSKISNMMRKKIRRTRRGTLVSEYVGVSWDRATRKWRARVFYDNKSVDIGKFGTEIEAAKAYDKLKYRVTRDVSLLNFPKDYV